MNEDYIKGIKFLLKKAKEQGINIRKAQWIPNVSKMLSERNLCYKFWYNTCNQNRVKKVLRCDNWYDLLYNTDVCAFLWITANEKPTFWKENFWAILGLDDDDDQVGGFTFYSRLMDMKL